MKKVCWIANTMIVILYSCSSVFGYLSFLEKTPPLIINRAALSKHDYAMLVGKCVNILNLLGGYLVNHFACRFQIWKSFGMNRKSKLWEHVIFSILLVTFAALIAIFFPDIIKAIEFLGGFGFVFTVIAFPMLIKV